MKPLFFHKNCLKVKIQHIPMLISLIYDCAFYTMQPGEKKTVTILYHSHTKVSPRNKRDNNYVL